MAWPNLTVSAGTYEFRLLNGSDSRFYVLRLDDPDVKVTLVGTDGGLLPHAVTIMDGDGVQESNEFLVLAPGDRVELVFDFSGALKDGETTQAVHFLNVGPDFSPFKGILTMDSSWVVLMSSLPVWTIPSATSCSSRCRTTKNCPCSMRPWTTARPWPRTS